MELEKSGTLLGTNKSFARGESLKQSNANKSVVGLKDVFRQDIDRIVAMTTTIGRLKDADLENARAALAELNPKGAGPAKIDDAKMALQNEVRQKRTLEDIKQAYDIFAKHRLLQ